MTGNSSTSDQNRDDPATVDPLRSWASAERRRAEELAAALDGIAQHGLPSPEECTPWETLRAGLLAGLEAEGADQRVA
ncbi:hypothetical protein OHV05_36720 (plasmid) [Kitasatospora sp. NBC_00070]|uniref:hypothetical protein n=1 Tax=Kitasatospora sp. NBC_00070 TaxID=2975962 RepID=UPI003245C8B4